MKHFGAAIIKSHEVFFGQKAISSPVKEFMAGETSCGGFSGTG